MSFGLMVKGQNGEVALDSGFSTWYYHETITLTAGPTQTVTKDYSALGTEQIFIMPISSSMFDSYISLSISGLVITFANLLNSAYIPLGYVRSITLIVFRLGMTLPAATDYGAKFIGNDGSFTLSESHPVAGLKGPYTPSTGNGGSTSVYRYATHYIDIADYDEATTIFISIPDYNGVTGYNSYGYPDAAQSAASTAAVVIGHEDLTVNGAAVRRAYILATNYTPIVYVSALFRNIAIVDTYGMLIKNASGTVVWHSSALTGSFTPCVNAGGLPQAITPKRFGYYHCLWTIPLAHGFTTYDVVIFKYAIAQDGSIKQIPHFLYNSTVHPYGSFYKLLPFIYVNNLT